jgi:hypothetical protein
MTLLFEDQHENDNPPTKEEFLNLTIHDRHVMIKHDLGSRRRITPYTWCYLYYPNVDMAIRCKVDRKRNIAAHEVYSIAEARELEDRTKMAVSASNHEN